MTRRTAILLGLVFVLVVGGALTARGLGIRAMKIESGSMVPAVEPRDWIVVKDIDHGDVRGIQRGDIVMFRFPPNGGPLRAIKRVVAVGEDRVEIGPRSVTVNGKTIAIAGAPSPRSARHRIETVPRGRFFLLGDNARVSIDSRSFGAIRPTDIVARHVLTAGSSGSVGLKAVVAIVLLAAAVATAMIALRRRSGPPARSGPPT